MGKMGKKVSGVHPCMLSGVKRSGLYKYKPRNFPLGRPTERSLYYRRKGRRKSPTVGV